MSLVFVSLFDTIKAVAQRITVSDEEVDPYSEAPLEEDDFLKNIGRLSARNCFQQSRAAHRLFSLFFTQYTETKWFDVVGVSLFSQSDKAKEDARQILIDYAEAEALFKNQVRPNQRAPSRFSDEEPKQRNRPSLSPPPSINGNPLRTCLRSPEQHCQKC